MSGTLYLCGTPIGNLEDITLRALSILKQVDIIAAEDTRHTLKLMRHYGIEKQLISYHQHNRKSRGEDVLQRLRDGQDVALVSDAGMPGISDPGTDLVQLALGEGVQVVPIPGPTAFVTGLVVSGFATDSFVFLGFPPRIKKERQQFWGSLKGEKRTAIFYESPHRLVKTLVEAEKQLGGIRGVAVARELTKLFEEVRRGSIEQVRMWFEEHPPKGEITVILSGYVEEKDDEVERKRFDLALEQVEELMASGLNRNEAVKAVARQFNLSKRELYNAGLKK